MNLALIVHGALVLVLAQAIGFAFFRSIQRDTAVQLWRMSHAATSAGAVFLIALGPVLPHLVLAPVPEALVADALIGSTYLLAAGTIVAAASGQRGTSARPPWPNRIVFVLYVAGAIISTLAALALLFGSVRAYLW